MTDDAIQVLTPEGIAPPFARYAHGVAVPTGARFVYTSGQLGLAPDGRVPEGVAEQAAICFGNVDRILAAGGATRADVVRINAYVTDRAHMQGYMQARDEWLREVDRLPTSTLVIVSGFTGPEFVVEVEVVAAVVP